MKPLLAFAMVSIFSLSAFAQDNRQPALAFETVGPATVYRVVVVNRTFQAINYRHRSGATDVVFAATDLQPSAGGSAKVRSKRGTVEVEAEFKSLQSPTSYGGEYLTYVLWAVSPEGQAVNLGEVQVGDNEHAKLTATTNLQSFALIVTAEPDYAVRQPSNVVILQNIVTADTKGTTEAVSASFDLLARGGYIPTGYKFDPVVLNASLPLEFYEARNALRIAQSEGAESYAAESYQHAVQLMNATDADALNKHVNRKTLIANARDTVQTAEEAREIAVKRIEEVRRADELKNSANAQTLAQNQAADANRQKLDAQSDAANSQSKMAIAQSDASKAQSDLATSQAASAIAITNAQSDAEQARNDAQTARQGQQQAVLDKSQMRAQLSEQLNRILATRDSARGLIVSMSDVLFDTGKYSLKPGAREKLAKVAGILISYPGLLVAVGGYTDNVGGDSMNLTLSQNRADAVRDYLVKQGVTTNAVSSKGFGDTLPVATNDDAAGRQENRRVELVVSGDVIGTTASSTTGSLF